jgi:tetratricopeptide (TPR) repeat protein
MVRPAQCWQSRRFSHATDRALFALVTLFLCVATPVVAHAQSEAEKKQQAREHYEKATRLYDVGKYGEAIKAYEEAYLLVEDAALLFNIGQAYRLWDRPEEAIRAYKNYLRRRPEATNRSDVEKKIADLERLIDDRKRGMPAQPLAQPGQPAQPLPAPGPNSYPYSPDPVPAGVAPGSSHSAMAAAPDGVVFAQPAPPAPAPAKRNWVAYSLLGAGGVCLLTAVVASAVGANRAKKLQDAAQNHQAFDPSVQSSGKAANAVAVLFGIAGLATGGVGGYLLWRGRGTSAPAVSVAPAVGQTVAGGSALLTF